MSELTTIFTGSYKIITPLHHYDRSKSNEDVIVIISNPYDSIHYIVVDNKYDTVLVRRQLPYNKKIKNTILAQYKNIRLEHLLISAVFGLYRTEGKIKTTTIFIVYRNIYTNKNYVVQLNLLNNDVNTTEIKPIIELFDKRHIYFDTTVTKNTEVNDFKNIQSIDTYITYINMDGRHENNIESANVTGLYLLVTEEDKNEFKYNHPNITLPETIYPILDTWSPDRMFFKLTDDTEKIKFNFSTGVGFIQFSK